MILDNVPNVTKLAQKELNFQIVSRKMIKDLAERRRAADFLSDLINPNLEVSLGHENDNYKLGKSHTGIKILDFFKLIVKYRVKLSKEEKQSFKEICAFKKFPEHLNLRQLYDVFSGFIDKFNQSEGSASESFHYTTEWEFEVYRKIAQYIARDHRIKRIS